MRKIAASILVLFLIFSAVSGFCDSDLSEKTFSCPFTSALIQGSAKDVVTNDMQRAVLSVGLLLDLGIDAEKDFMSVNFGEIMLNDSYVASDGQFLVFSGFAAGYVVSIFYSPEGGIAMYSLIPADLSDEYLAMVVKSAAENYEYSYKNDVSDMAIVLNAISEAMSSN